MSNIILVLLSNIDDGLVAVLKQRLENTFNSSVRVVSAMEDLAYSYDVDRKQYRSPLLLERLERINRSREHKILGVVDVDLYSPGYDFIYGEANQSTGIATLSTYRLRSRKSNRQSALKVFRERVVREALHEVGHLFGLGHCTSPKCVMRTCICSAEVDKAGNEFCPQCHTRLTTEEVGVD